MLKIVDVHLSANVHGEYIVIQNQGLTTISLRGWIVVTEDYLCADSAIRPPVMYVFREDAPIKPYARVVLFTGHGTDGWHPTNDGKPAYVAYWGSDEFRWAGANRCILLQPASTKHINALVGASMPIPV